MQIYMICGIGLCLRVGKKKNLYVANEIVRTNHFFLGEKSSKGKQQQLMYVAKRKIKLNESSNFTFKKEKLGSMLPLVCLLATFLMIVYKNMN